MSVDYTDMAFPKPGKKKKRKKHKKSILHTQKGICYLCAHLNGDYRQQYTEEHHILYGSGRREISEAEGLKVNLCPDHHRNGQQAVHNSRETRNCSAGLLRKSMNRTIPAHSGCELRGKIIYRHLCRMAMVHTVCHV